MSPPEERQLEAIARLHARFAEEGIDYWLFGGWAVDFHARAVTRAHGDIDAAVWQIDLERIARILHEDGWTRCADLQADGYTAFERGGLRVELAHLARDPSGVVYTPLRDGRASWPQDAFQRDVAELRGVSARVITLRALRAEKAEAREDDEVSAKDALDRATLSRLVG